MGENVFFNFQMRLDMNATARQEPMQRKPILMPPGMIKNVNIIAKTRNVSFAEVVREAVRVFADQPTQDDEALLEALAKTMIETTKTLSKRIDELEKQLDKTHAILETS